MHSISELKDILGYTSDQLRLRLKKLKPILNETVRRGENNKILVTSDGLEILRRAKQLENNNIPLNEIPGKLKQEMDQNEDEASDDLAQTDRNLLQEKDRRIEDLKSRIKELKEDKRYWRDQAEELQQKLITGEVEEETKQEASPWELFKNWLLSP